VCSKAKALLGFLDIWVGFCKFLPIHGVRHELVIVVSLVSQKLLVDVKDIWRRRVFSYGILQSGRFQFQRLALSLLDERENFVSSVRLDRELDISAIRLEQAMGSDKS
jgi:hypothetical protein